MRDSPRGVAVTRPPQLPLDTLADETIAALPLAMRDEAFFLALASALLDQCTCASQKGGRIDTIRAEVDTIRAELRELATPARDPMTRTVEDLAETGDCNALVVDVEGVSVEATCWETVGRGSRALVEFVFQNAHVIVECDGEDTLADVILRAVQVAGHPRRWKRGLRRVRASYPAVEGVSDAEISAGMEAL